MYHLRHPSLVCLGGVTLQFHLIPSLSGSGWKPVGDEDGRDSALESQSRHGGREEESDSSSSASSRSGDGGESKDDDSPADDGLAESASTEDSVHKSPSPSATASWEKALRFPRPGTSFRHQASTFSRPLKLLSERWADPVAAPSFAAPRKDDCLAGTFDKVYSSDKQLHDLAFEAMKRSGAAAHATLAASSHIGMEVPKLVSRMLATLLPEASDGHDEWASWMKKEVDSILRQSSKAILDAVQLNASLYGKAYWVMRDAVTKQCDKSVQPVLKNCAPSANSFFGNPSEAIQSSVGLAFMTDQLRHPARGAKRSSFAARAPRASTSSAAVASPSPAAGNGKGRKSRGGPSGRGRKK